MATGLKGTPVAAEQKFENWCADSGANFHRAGWPDYLVRMSDGHMIGVEVKDGDDVLSPSQRRCFELLEELEVRVVVWNPRSPDELCPWRHYVPGKSYAKRRGRTTGEFELKPEDRWILESCKKSPLGQINSRN